MERHQPSLDVELALRARHESGALGSHTSTMQVESVHRID
jgi:hypothetical protein